MVKEIKARILDRFKSWFVKSRHVLFFWRKEDSQEKPAQLRSLEELPDSVRKNLADAIKNLSSNPADVKAIASKLEETFARWCKDPDNSANSIVILSSPVTVVSRILSEALEEWADQKQVSIKVLSLKARPNDTQTIKSQLEDYLENQSQEDNHNSQEREVIVIPNLCWCFLRSVEGLKGIEYLQLLLCNHPSSIPQQHNHKKRFWIFGANHIGWDYLNLVFNLQAYCGEVVTLPEIESKELQEWFEPITNEFKLTFARAGIDQQLLDQDKDDKTLYFERLTTISQKISIVATQVFLQSISYQETDEEKSESSQKVLVARNPKLPDLPTLEPADQYLLYSLLLHDDLTISALAESLGDEEAEVQGIVQMLSRYGVIEQQNKTLSINPIHYPRLKQQLQNNNFIINRG